MLYLAVGTALHSESYSPLMIYRALYDNTLSRFWARPSEMFFEDVEPGRRRFSEVATVRVATPEDKAELLSFGFDAWGSGHSSVAEFVSSYAEDKNHLRGQRYLLELPSGDKIASVNTLRFARRLVGLASLSVSLEWRKRGYASTLLRAVMELFRLEDADTRFVLFSEVSPSFYEKLGFSRLPEELQFHLPSIAMATGQSPLYQTEVPFLQEYF